MPRPDVLDRVSTALKDADAAEVIDRITSSFDGFAWSENLGWLHFKSAEPFYNVVTHSDVPVEIPTFTVR